MADTGMDGGQLHNIGSMGPPPAPRRNYAEELEKTEQSITLALQEIDRNFARAHKIVATTIVPVIERYGQESRRVWQGAAFWKQFLEASANVSLSGYEEIAAPMEDEDGQQQPEEDEYDGERYPHDAYAQKLPVQYGDESTLQTVDGVKEEDSFNASTTDHDQAKTPRNKVLSSGSPKVKKEKSEQSMMDDDTSLGLPDPPSATTRIFMNQPATSGAGQMLPPRTPVHQHQDSLNFNSVASSPFNSKLDIIPADYHNSPSIHKESTSAGVMATTPGVLRHRVLDKNWKIQMTPGVSSTVKREDHGASNAATAATPHRIRGYTPSKPTGKQSFAARFDSSPLDGLEPPQLQTDIQFSPTPAIKKNPAKKNNTRQTNPATTTASFMTPRKEPTLAGAGDVGGAPKTPIQRFYAYNNELSDSSFGASTNNFEEDDDDEMDTTMKTPDRFAAHQRAAAAQGGHTQQHSFFDDDEDTSMNGFGLPDGMSPPVTMNFTVPSNVLQRTPAREAAQSMVKDILRGAGADDMELD